MDGIETLREMQKRGMLTGDMSVIMMTANAIAGAREEYLKEGFDDYLSKPIEVKTLKNVLEMAGKEGRLEDVRAGHDDLMSEFDEILKEAQGVLA